MNVETKTSGKKSRITLSGELTVRTAGQLRQSLLDALSAPDDLGIQFIDVDDADLSLLQLLCAANKTARTGGKNLTIEGITPDIIVNLINRTGFCNHSSYSDHECIWNNSDMGETS